MIIKSTKLIETDGNFDDEIEMKVNTANTSKLFELLISSYKNARASFIRETVSNAYDAQIENKNTSEPVVININYDDSGWFIEIIDKGVGMSKEFVEQIYSSLLTSTKDSSNEQIGGFGIGSKSPLAYYPQFSLSTVKEGKLNTYLIYREGTGLPKITRMIIDEDTDLHSGTTVKIPLIEDEHEDGYSWRKKEEQEYILEVAVKELSFFDNVIIKAQTKNSYITADYNAGKIIDGGTFLFRTSCQYSEEMHLVIGKVCYPIDWKQIGKRSISIPIGIKFNIGDFQVNMTREDIIYDDETKTKISKAIDDVCAKLESIYREQNKEFDNFHNYLKAVEKFKNHRKAKIQFLEDDDNSCIDITSIFKTFDKTLTFKRFKEHNLSVNINANLFSQIIDVVNDYTNGSLLFRKEYPLNNFEFNKKQYHKKLVLIDNQKPNKIESKDFIKYHENFNLIKIRSLKSCYKELVYLLGLNETKSKRYLAHDSFRDFVEVSEKYFYSKRPVDLTDPLNIRGCESLGWSIKVYNYYKIIKEEFYKLCEEQEREIIKYETFQIPQEWYDEQKAIAKALRDSYKSLSGQIKIQLITKNLDADERIVHLEKLKKNNKLIFYGNIREKSNLFITRTILNCFKNHENVFLNKNYSIVWQTLKSDDKIMESISNTVKADIFLKTPNRILLKFLIACDFYIRYYERNLCSDNYINKLKDINSYYANLIDKLYGDLINEFSFSSIRNFLSKHSKEYEALKKVIDYNNMLAYPIYDKYSYKLKQIDSFFENAELLKNYELVSNSENKMYLVDYLKLKKKRVNVNYYTSGENIVKPIIKEKENTFTGWGINTTPFEWNPKQDRNQLVHLYYKKEEEPIDLINNDNQPLNQKENEFNQKMA